MLDRPGLNPWAKFREAPFGGSDRLHDRPSIATNTPRWALPPLLGSSPIPADLVLQPTP